MHKSFRLSVVLGLILVFVGCVAVQVTPLGNGIIRPPVQPSQIAIYRTAAQVPGKYEEVALLTAEGDYAGTTEGQMYEKMRAAAAKQGANGIILDSVSEPSTGAKVASFFLFTNADRKGKAIAIYVLPADVKK